MDATVACENPPCTGSERNDERIQAEFRHVQNRWRTAVKRTHGATGQCFSARLASLAEASCLEARSAGRHTGRLRLAAGDVRGEQPYELRPVRAGAAGRVWHAFDAAVAQLTSGAATTDLLAVADAYDAFAARVLRCLRRRARGWLRRPLIRRPRG